MMVGGPHPIKRELAKQLSVATTMTELLFVKVNWAQLLEIKTERGGTNSCQSW